ncbi:hypothetical protein CCP1ISM_590004 [Azospirillaceae bacterium]
MNLSTCNKLLNLNLTDCGDGFCADDETFLTCDDCIPKSLYKLGKNISPSKPLYGLIFLGLLIVAVISSWWYFDVGKKVKKRKKEKEKGGK